MEQLHEFSEYKIAVERHAEFKRLNRHPFSIFRTARRTWAFWTL